jgi:hypothetical protein
MSNEKGWPARMRALSFMAGEWDLDYTVTQHGVTTKPIRGTGSLHYIHAGVYLVFDYQMQQAETGNALGEAHAIFAWDAKTGKYRYFWFESSGNRRGVSVTQTPREPFAIAPVTRHARLG